MRHRGAVCPVGHPMTTTSQTDQGPFRGPREKRGLLPLAPIFPHPDAHPDISGCHHKVPEASRLTEHFIKGKKKKKHEKHQFILQLDDVAGPPKLGPQLSPGECSSAGNRKLIRFSWGLCQLSPSPEYKAVHRYGVSFTHLAVESREGEGIINGTRLGAPKDREAIIPRRL